MTKYIEEAKVVGQRILNATTKQIDLIAPRIAAEAVPGQFVNVQVSQRTAPLLRRPLGVAGVDKNYGAISLIYRIVGDATNILADVPIGVKDLLTDDMSISAVKRPIASTCPLLFTALMNTSMSSAVAMS